MAADLVADDAVKLTPLKPLDLGKVKNFDDLTRQMADTAFGARAVGEATDILHKMVIDKDCFVVLTLSGAMTVAKMGLLVCDMIDNNMVSAVVSTGAIMAHGFIEAVGMRHFKVSPEMDDREMYYKGFDRVYDTLELEKNLDNVDIILENILKTVDEDKTLSSFLINELLGKYLSEQTEGRGILKSAYKKKVPVFVPAFTDSELGLNMAIHNKKRRLNNKKELTFNPLLDLDQFTELINRQKTLGIFTVGGGVPRNWAQQVGPYLDITEKSLPGQGGFKRYKYGVRICPEPVHWGGLSGCTYSEGVSWGKFIPPKDGGRWSEVYSDATIAWPIILKAAMERMEK